MTDIAQAGGALRSATMNVPQLRLKPGAKYRYKNASTVSVILWWLIVPTFWSLLIFAIWEIL